MLYIKPPKDFKSIGKAVSCYIYYDDKILLLKRNDDKNRGGLWGRPGGKADKSKNLVIELLREVQEETGLKLDKNKLKYYNKVYVRHPKFDFIYHLFSVKLDLEPRIVINTKERQDYQWVRVRDVLKINLVQDEAECISIIKKSIG
ncbi:MAG: hypothetical protein ACD_58C00167G0006 [uncultured bacterium]|nr:MAG: hypothetical protein ACD_58C00167G0006 [uncultured bacterium]